LVIPTGEWVSTARPLAADFNADGKLDLAVASWAPSDNSVTILIGNRDGGFQSATKYNIVAGAILNDGFVVGDFNGDDMPDLAMATGSLASSYDGAISMLLNAGNGTFQAPVHFEIPGPELETLKTGDFNGDGRLDLATLTDAHTVSVRLGNGDGTFQRPFTDVIGGWLAVADFDGDGRSDVATQDGLSVHLPGVALSGASVLEHRPIGTTVGTLTTASSDPGNFFDYQFTNGTGDDDNASFTIDDSGNLKTAAEFDFGTKSSYTVRVRSTDSVGVVGEEIFKIGVIPPLIGDYNLNGVVDAADHVVWRDTLGASDVTPYSGADGDGDGEITANDRSVWMAHFGEALSAAAAGADSGRLAILDTAFELPETTVPAQADETSVRAIAFANLDRNFARSVSAVRPRGSVAQNAVASSLDDRLLLLLASDQAGDSPADDFTESRESQKDSDSSDGRDSDRLFNELLTELFAE
jgi:hypothetical protein